MMRELTNLLPPDRARALRRVYFLRLAVVGTLLFAGVAVVHGVLLLPTYLHVQGAVMEREAVLASLSGEGVEEEEIGTRIKALSSDSAYLGRLGTLPKASAAVARVIELPRPGVTLYGFSFMPQLPASDAVAGATMTVSGIAATREALRTYVASLEAAPYIDAADLPISAYAKERDIEFSITLSGPFLP